jgi:hypothetical protein
MNDVRSPIWMAVNLSFKRSKPARRTNLECLPGVCADDVANANKGGANAVVVLKGNTPRAVGLEGNDLPRDGILDILHLTWLRRIEHERQGSRLRIWCESARRCDSRETQTVLMSLQEKLIVRVMDDISTKIG